MKKFAVVMLSVLTVPAYAQSMLESLQTYQKEIQAKSSSSTAKSDGPAPAPSEPVTSTKSSGQCSPQDKQTSLPLAYITAMLMEKDGKLQINHDPRNGKISVTSPEMISNCSSMIQWHPNTRTVDGRKVYSLEARIKKGADCVDDVCEYDMAVVEKGSFKAFEKVKVKATMEGFVECLDKSGVRKDGKVVADAIYPSPIDESFEGFKDTGDLLFMSHGPSSKLIKGKYDKFVEVDKCDHYEKITPEGMSLVSVADSQAKHFAEEEEKIRNCGEYGKISDFMARYEEEYSEDLNAIRDKLIIEAVKKATKAIAEGKYTEEDLKVLADFDKYIVQPKIRDANTAYTKAQLTEGSDKAAAIAEMKAALAELNTYNAAPFVSAAVVAKLEAEGRFQEAQVANGIKVTIGYHQKLGNKEAGKVFTPEFVAQKVAAHNAGYEKEIEGKKEIYEIKTGQLTGKSKEYSDTVSAYNRNIQMRSQSYTQAIQDSLQDIQPGGYCFRSPFRNSQKCYQETVEYVQALQTQMQNNNKVDYELAQENYAKAQEYLKLEKEGAAYVARQNGEAPAATAQPDTITAPTREQYAANNGQGQNPYQQGNGVQTQVQMNGQMQGQNPYQQPGYGQPQYYQQQQGYNQYGQQNMMGQNPYQQQGMTQQYPNYNNQAQFGFQGQYNIGFGNQQQGYNQYGQQNMMGQNPYQQQGYQQNPYSQQSMYGNGQAQGWSPYGAYQNQSVYGQWQ